MKMLLVDDEVLTLDYLERIFDWEAMGIQIIGRALNGEEASDFILREKPDIILVDIKMPRMDGLELIEWVRNRDLSMKIIILSAYGEFQYAQKALAYGAVGYLLKPVDEAKLEDMMNKVIEQIKEEKMKEQSISELTKQLTESNKNSYPRTLNQQCNVQDSLENRESTNNLVIHQAQEYIKENYDQNITLDEIAYEVDMSKNYFSYLFKRETGICMWDFLTQIRIEKARELLKESNSKIYEVAYKVGYENSSYFNKMFKRYTGMTPREYKMNQ